MHSNFYEEKLRELARQAETKKEEYRNNPLAQYSTTELKAELRRRKNR